jgi:hypothetical protein
MERESIGDDEDRDPFNALVCAALGPNEVEDAAAVGETTNETPRPSHEEQEDPEDGEEHEEEVHKAIECMSLSEKAEKALRLNLQQVHLITYQMNLVESELKYLAEVTRKTKQIMVEFQRSRKNDGHETISPEEEEPTDLQKEGWEGEGQQVDSGVSLPVCRSLGYLCDRQGRMPPDNPDALVRMSLQGQLDQLKGMFRRRRWTLSDRLNLRKGVRQQNQQLLLMPFLNAYQMLHEQEDRKREAENALMTMQDKMVSISELADEELEINTEGIDWERLANIHLPDRCGDECRIRYLNVEHPSIEKGSWTREEDEQLKRIASKYHGRYWESIATELGVSSHWVTE